MIKKSGFSLFVVFLLFSGCALANSLNSEIVLTTNSVWDVDGFEIMAMHLPGDNNGYHLKFIDRNTGKNIDVKYLSLNDKGDIEDLHLVGMQVFNNMFVVTLETATSFLSKVFLYDKKYNHVIQIINDGSRVQPEFMYYGEFGSAAIGFPRMTLDSKSSIRFICAESIYFFDKKNQRIDRVNIKKNSDLKINGVLISSLSCE